MGASFHARVLEEYGEATSSRFACASTLQNCEKWTQRTDLNADALAFGETQRIKRTETRRDCWKISEKGASAHLCAVARFKSGKNGRCDAEDAADEIRRENGEKTTQLYLNPSFFIPHSSFFIPHSSFIIMRFLRILISFCASTLVDEVCQIASKEEQ